MKDNSMNLIMINFSCKIKESTIEICILSFFFLHTNKFESLSNPNISARKEEEDANHNSISSFPT